jgi:hypothetical protein
MPELCVYDADQAAEILRCTAAWLKEKARKREIPFTMLAGAYRFTDTHLAEIIRIHEQAPAEPPLRQQNRRAAVDADLLVLRARPPRRARRAPGLDGQEPEAPMPAARDG